MADSHDNKNHHHLLTDRTVFQVGGTLFVLTALTVGVAFVDLGSLNFVVAMLVASIKATLVAMFFMNLKYDKRENAAIFGTSFLFLAIFISLTSMDIFFRGDVYVKGPLTAAVAAAPGASKFSKPWNASPDLIKRGQEIFGAQCVSCHGAQGRGDGVAAAALTPPPRNFTVAEGWKNGRKPSQVFKTLKEGLAGSAMASYASLPAEDRWALTHFVLSIGPQSEADTAADLAKVGVDPNKDAATEVVARTVPISVAMAQMAEPETRRTFQSAYIATAAGGGTSAGAQLYQRACIQCHGPQGEGGIRVKALGINPPAFITTQRSLREAASYESFAKTVSQGVPGDLMPGYGHLSASEMKDLYQYVRGFAAR